jgi:8-oxo-dGTP diphosphatase
MGFVLLLVAIVLSVILFPIGLIYSLFRPNKQEQAYRIAYAIDQLGNVVMADAFNKWLISDNGIPFGNPDETVSSCLGKNKRAGTLTKSGIFLDKILEWLDNGHSIKSIEEDEKTWP